MAWLLLGQLSCQCWCPYSDGIWHGICTAFIVPTSGNGIITCFYGNDSNIIWKYMYHNVATCTIMYVWDHNVVAHV